MKLLPTLVIGLCAAVPAAAALSQLCTASRPHWTAALFLTAGCAPLVASREVHRNKDDKRRMRLTKEKVQHVERAIRYADYGDGYARLER
jgi:hypothetical protein